MTDPLPYSPLPGADQSGSLAEAAQGNFDALAMAVPEVTRTYARSTRTSNAGGTADYTTTGTASPGAAIDATNLSLSVYCVGADMRVIFRGSVTHTVSNARVIFVLRMDGATLPGDETFIKRVSVNGEAESFEAAWDVTPSRGTHVFSVNWYSSVAGTATLLARAGNGAQMVVERA